MIYYSNDHSPEIAVTNVMQFFHKEIKQNTTPKPSCQQFHFLAANIRHWVLY